MMMLLHKVYKIIGVKTMNILERNKIALQAKKITELYKKRNEIQAELEKEKGNNSRDFRPRTDRQAKNR